ncbi:F-box only protein 40 Muscle disease-related protein [Channa argus]|uniref:F-box only protein 40 Muscle disease-related protein n=1 Tax=Channa argus TaxID=215402 RepID=A0A6G1QSX8_CHAAH|nr:F-box only protein 40 Muscle disease-related protein [Channa argus]
MSHRSRSFRVQQHVHCDSCYSRRCRARVEASVCCAVTPCCLHCGALFHLCKEEDHLLLCPNVRVPCLNSAYGCPVQLPRSSQAAHLQVCPASVVCCSMEWLRWPADDTNLNCSMVLQENVLKENEAQGEALDVAMALVDQSDLFHRLKMKPLYEELMEEEEEEEEEKEEEEIKEKKAEIAVGGIVNGAAGYDADKETLWENNDAKETAQMNVGQNLELIKEKYNLTEMMFSMERGGCAVAEASLQNAKQDQKPSEKGIDQTGGEKGSADHRETEKDDVTGPDTSKTGLAPWQDGVLERLGQELSPQEYNMYVVHHGRMLLAFGQIEACTPRDKDFVYGSLEPIPVQTLCSFKVPDSYHYKRRAHLYDTAARAQSQTCCVDTSDLGANEQDWFCDEAAATLLGYAEKEVMGHKISESKETDGLYVDVGTQTHSFRSAPFKGKTTLAEAMGDTPLKLHLQLQSASEELQLAPDPRSITRRRLQATQLSGLVCCPEEQRRL